MGDSDQISVEKVLLATIRPIASMLLRFGVNYLDFDRVCKAAFVEAATHDFGIRGKPANVSRIALMTGLTRKVVRRVQDRQPEPTLSTNKAPSLPSEVLNVWHTDFRFCSTYGKPKALTWDSDSSSFCSLVHLCSRSVTPATMRAELKRVGAITDSENGLIVALRRSFIPATAEERLIQGLQYGLRPLAMTVAHNAATRQEGDLRFQRLVWNYCLPRSMRGAVHELIGQRLKDFSQEIDDLLSEADRSDDRAERSVVGVGLYEFEDDGENFKS